MVLPSLSLSRSMEGKGGGLGRFFKTKSRDDDSKKMKEKQTRTRPGLFRLNSSRSECLTATPTRCSTDDGEFKDDLSYSFEQTPNRDPPGKGSGTPPLRETRSSPTKADTTWFVEEYLRERSSSADLSSPVRKPDGRIFLRRLEEARSLDLTKRQSLSSVASKMPLSDDPEENSHDSENLDKESKDDISEVDLEATIPYKREYSTSKNSSRSHRSKVRYPQTVFTHNHISSLHPHSRSTAIAAKITSVKGCSG